MIYKEIDFMFSPFHYHLEFEARITMVRGDSATGKTYLYQALEDLRQTEEYKRIKLLNYKSEDFHEELKGCKDKFVVIDNGDILIDDEDRRFINFDRSNQYLLFMRNCDGINMSRESFTILKEQDGEIGLVKELA